MPGSLCILVSRPPYGTLEPAEAIRHARGALAKGWRVVALAFLGESVQALLPGQSPTVREWVSLAEAVTAFMDEGKDRARVLAEGEALGALGLSTTDLIQGALPASLDEIARTVADSDRALVF